MINRQTTCNHRDVSLNQTLGDRGLPNPQDCVKNPDRIGCPRRSFWTARSQNQPCGKGLCACRIYRRIVPSSAIKKRAPTTPRDDGRPSSSCTGSDRHSNTIKTGHSRPHALKECYGHSSIYLYILWLNRHYAQEGAAGVSLHQVRGPPRSIPSP